MAEPKHVFISHSSKDRAKAEEVDAILRGWGLQTWMAPRDIGSGGTFAGQITKAVDRASAMVVIVTPAACKSKFVHVEVERAFQKKKRLYPVRFDPVKLSGDIEFYLSAYQWVDAFEDDREDAIERLAYDLGGRAVTGENDLPPPPPPPPPPATVEERPIPARPPPPPPATVEERPISAPPPPPPPPPPPAGQKTRGFSYQAIVPLIFAAVIAVIVIISQLTGRAPDDTANNTAATTTATDTETTNAGAEDSMTGMEAESANTTTTNTAMTSNTTM